MWQVALPVQIGQSLRKLILNLSLLCCGVIIAGTLWWPLRVTSLRDMASLTLQPVIPTSLALRGTLGAVTAVPRAAPCFVEGLGQYLWRAASKAGTRRESITFAPEYAIKLLIAFWRPLLFNYRSQATLKCERVASLGQRMGATLRGFLRTGDGPTVGTTAMRPYLPNHHWTQQAPSFQVGLAA